MARKMKYDGVVDAVHYDADGRLKWVRAYERRGPTWSDYVLIPRKQFIERLKDGKVYMVGNRTPLLASTFEVSAPIRLIEKNSEAFVVSGEDRATDGDNLDDVPVI